MLLSLRKPAHPSFSLHPIRWLLALLPLWLALLVSDVQPVLAQDSIASAPATYLIQFQPDTSATERDAWLASQGVELLSWLPQIGVAEVRMAGEQAESLAASLALSAAGTTPIAYVEANTTVSGDRVITDPAYSDTSRGYAQQMLRIAAAWDVTEGDNDIVVAIVDTGINPNHPEFAGRIIAGYDYVNNDDDPLDDNGHGTHIAGIVAAGLNGIGTVGVCPQCKLMPVKVLDERSGGNWGLVAKGILYAVDHGARVINLSLGATISSLTLENAIQYAQKNNVVVVAAAGNLGIETPFYPAAIPYVIAVSGTDRFDLRWSQSNYGNFVDVAAPAVSIYSSYYDLVNTSGYAFMSGTSMATPFVSGLAGLVLSRQPELTGTGVTELITQNAIDLGASGKDKEFGYGRIDVYATLLAANGGVAPAPTAGGGGAAIQLYLPAIRVAK
jgi:subtilisin family serine protease